jgi:ammonia channel protein AmtB
MRARTVRTVLSEGSTVAYRHLLRGAYVCLWGGLCAGMLAGLVSSAATCAIVPAWAGIIGGALAAISAQYLAHWCPLIGIDDPVNAGVLSCFFFFFF